MATISPTLSLTSSITGFRYQGADIILDFQLLDAAGVARASKSYLLRADGTGVYDQQTGAQIVAVTPAAFLTAATSLKTQADGALTAAAAAGKVTL